MFKIIIFFISLGIANSQVSNPVGISKEKGNKINPRQINTQGADCIHEINRVRQRYGKPLFVHDDNLQTAAFRHNAHMVENNCFSIQCRGEPTLGERVSRVGYRWSKVGEVISANQKDCSSTVDGWLRNPSQRDYLLGEYRDLGCSQLYCNHCQYQTYWTCTLADPDYYG